MISAKNFSVALKNASPKRKINNDSTVAIPNPKKSIFKLPLTTDLIDSITGAIGFNKKKNLPDDWIIEIG